MNLPPTVPEQKNLCHEIQGLLREARRYTYRIALGPHQGRKGSTLQTVPVATESIDGRLGAVNKLA